MSAGWLVAHGANPYTPADLAGVFGNPAFRSATSFGYPPPWALVSTLAYLAASTISKSVFLYNFLLKLPLIAANLALAFVVRETALESGGDEAGARRAFAAILLNPLLILTTAWGQIDAVVALLALPAVLLLSRRAVARSAILLALACSIKPTVLPLIPLALVATSRISFSTSLRWLAVFAATVAILCVLPFAAFGWSPGIVLSGWNAHFSTAGGLSLLAFFELLGKGYALPKRLGFLGFVWFPAVLAYWLALPRTGGDSISLLRQGAGLLLVFFLTRSWLSEPNLDALAPFVAVLAALGVLGEGSLPALWIPALCFSLLNFSLPQLLFLISPDIGSALDAVDAKFRVPRLVARSLCVLPWQVAGWRLAISCLGRGERAVSGERRAS